MILLPLFICHVIFFPTAMIFPFPLPNLIFFPNRNEKTPPTQGGNKELSTPLVDNVVDGGVGAGEAGEDLQHSGHTEPVVLLRQYRKPGQLVNQE